MFKLNWKQEDPECVKGLIFSTNTEIPNYWLQVYDCGRFYIAAIYGISAYGRFELMGNEYCDSIEDAKSNCEKQWQDFRERSSLYPKAGAK